MGDFFNLILVHPIINVLVAIYSVLSFVHIPYALGFAIIGLTVVIRFIMYPLTTSQLKASAKMQKVTPLLSKIKEKYKGDSKRIQEETMKLYKEQGINPAAGCLPVIIQMPLIWALYSVLRQIVGDNPLVMADINKIVYFDFLKIQNIWDPSFFGLSLGAMPSKLISTMGPLILLVPILTGVFQFILSKMMIPAKTGVAVLEKDIEKKGNIDKKDSGDFASAFQTQAMFIFPVMIGFFAFSFPIGLTLYWNTFTVFGIIQQYQVAGLGGLSAWIKKK
ncbi:MAG: YidC/Oxa1 family membrane protein insertase [Candidatus Levybacteria bacterium]|nr:YidC/Oxa1 family membrane protein insertase [Candidatus Levybacteria bacterium]